MGCGTYELRGATWNQVTALPAATNRFEQQAAYDVTTGLTVVFGGEWLQARTMNPVYLGDTWTWDGTGWASQSPSAAPTARAYHAMVSLPHGGVLLFGGISATGDLADTWSWNGTNWVALATPVAPLKRNSHGMAYDPVRGYALLYGGISGVTALGDTWAWDGTAWRELLASAPNLGGGANLMTYDPVRGRVFHLGNAQTPFEWDGTAWREIITLLPAIENGAIAYDALGSRVVLLNGYDRTTWQGRWTYDGEVDESCLAGEDLDGDGLAGCDDPDCWGYCTPYCPPRTPCDATAPHCGDGKCNAALEMGRCPQDCP
jgi:hypothetical protein